MPVSLHFELPYSRDQPFKRLRHCLNGDFKRQPDNNSESLFNLHATHVLNVLQILSSNQTSPEKRHIREMFRLSKCKG